MNGCLSIELWFQNRHFNSCFNVYSINFLFEGTLWKLASVIVNWTVISFAYWLFQTFMLVSILALYHGLIFLPVALSIIGPPPYLSASKENTEVCSLNYLYTWTTNIIQWFNEKLSQWKQTRNKMFSRTRFVSASFRTKTMTNLVDENNFSSFLLFIDSVQVSYVVFYSLFVGLQGAFESSCYASRETG